MLPFRGPQAIKLVPGVDHPPAYAMWFNKTFLSHPAKPPCPIGGFRFALRHVVLHGRCPFEYRISDKIGECLRLLHQAADSFHYLAGKRV